MAGVITQALGAVGRHRRVVLGAGLVLAAGYLVIHLWIPSPGRRAFPAMAVATAVLLLLSVVATARPRPQSFVVDPAARAFRTPPQPAFVFVALAFLPLATGMAGNVVRDRGSEPFLPDQLVELGYAVVLILWVVIAWRDDSVQLRPDGVWQRGITGWLVATW